MECSNKGERCASAGELLSRGVRGGRVDGEGGRALLFFVTSFGFGAAEWRRSGTRARAVRGAFFINILLNFICWGDERRRAVGAIEGALRGSSSDCLRGCFWALFIFDGGGMCACDGPLATARSAACCKTAQRSRPVRISSLLFKVTTRVFSPNVPKRAVAL